MNESVAEFTQRRNRVKLAADGHAYILNVRFDASKRGALLIEPFSPGGYLAVERNEFTDGGNLTFMDRASWDAYDPDKPETNNGKFMGCTEMEL